MSVRIQGNALKAASYSLTESAGAFLPAPPSIDASSIDASSIAEALVQKVEKVLKKKSTEKQEVVSEDVLELGRHIGMNDLCWMRRPSSQPDFAHLGVMVQIGQGGHSNRCKILLCDIEDQTWIDRKKTQLFPFKAGASCVSFPNFMEKFSRRHDDRTQAFLEALTLAEMYVDDANPNRDEVFKLLKMGFTKRQEIVAVHKGLSIHKQNLLDVAEMKNQKSRRKRVAKRKLMKLTERIQKTDQVIDKEVVPGKDADSCARKKSKKMVTTKSKVDAITNASKTARKQNGVAKKRKVKPLTKMNGVAKKRKVKPLTKSTSNKRSMTLIAAAVRNPSPRGVAEKRNKSDDSTPSIAVATNVSHKRRSSTVEAQCAPDSTLVQSVLPKGSRKKLKHNGAEEVSSGPPLALNRTKGRGSLELQSQMLQKAPTKRDSSGHELCAHNCRPYNCPKCIKHTFVSWKPRTSDDGLDDSA